MRESIKGLPLARSARLVVKELHGELLVYDLDRDRAHCLNESAALIWRLCDGCTTLAEISSKLEKITEHATEHEFIWLAIDQLGRYNLLIERLEWPHGVPRISRREAVRRIAMGAAWVLPIVISITAPRPAQAASCKASGEICADSSECCDGFCLGNHHCR